MQNDNKPKKDNLLEEALDQINEVNSSETDDYPVEFVENIPFMFSGILVQDFGEIYGVCSKSLYELCENNPELKLFISDTIRRVLSCDFGDINTHVKKSILADFSEGWAIRCSYPTKLIDEGRIYLDVGKLEDTRIPRAIHAMLPSDVRLIIEWECDRAMELGGLPQICTSPFFD